MSARQSEPAPYSRIIPDIYLELALQGFEVDTESIKPLFVSVAVADHDWFLSRWLILHR